MKAAVIGCGYMGSLHARTYNKMDNVELVGVYDKDIKKARELEYNVFSSIEEVISSGIDAVSICTPTETHLEIALPFANAGVNLLIEKPVTKTLEQAQTLMKLKEENNIKIGVGHIERFNPVFLKVREYVRNENADPMFVLARRIGPLPKRIRKTGALHELTIHDVDLILNLFGEPKTVQCLAKYQDVNRYRVETHLHATLTYENFVASVESSRLYKNKLRKIIIHYRDKKVEGDFLSKEFIISENDSKLVSERLSADQLAAELNDFIEAISKDVEPEVTLEDAIVSLRIIENALESTKRMVK